MKQIKRLVGLLLCLAMVLSVMPASIISVSAADTTNTKATVTSDVLEKINLNGTADGGCSQNGASVSDIEDLIWYHETDGHATWNTYELAADGNKSTVSAFNCGGNERADWYLDLSGNDNGYTAVDKFVLYAGGTTSVPTTKVIFILADGGQWEETFTTNWDSADDTLTYTFDETIKATGMYVWQTQNTRACLGEIELYHYIQIEALETAKINGVDLSQYKIVYSASDLDYAKTAAEYIQEQILLKTGRQVEVVTDATDESTYEILVGNTSRTYSKSISAPSEITTKFTFASNGTKIAMKADYFIIAGAAYYFVETYIGDTDFDVTVNTGVTTQSTITKPAKNFIMLIGDGMGVSQTEMFEYYDITDPSQYDPKYNMSDGEDIFYGYYFPYEGRSRTWNVLNEITDSGAGGTALATGYKTYNQHIGQNSTQIGTAQVYDEGAWQTVPVCQEVESLTELALRMGKSAAVMSTEETWGATPSSFSAHMYNRYEYNDIWADQDELRDQGVIFVDHDRYLNQFTAAEWEDAKPYYKAALEQIAQDPDGFFMMYEEAYIDKECHNNRPDLSYMTMVRFNQAIAMFMEFAMYNPETLVLITADHETGGLAATSNGLECTEPNPNSSGFNHTLMEVPVFAYGAGADAFATNIVDPHDYYSQYNGWYHNTSIARTFGYMMGDENFGDPQFPILTSDYEPEPEDPNAPKLSALSGLATPEFGYYSNNNTNGTLTSYYNSSYVPGNLVDGDHSNQTRSQVYTYAEVTSGAKVPAIVFDLGGEKDIAAVEVDTYKATYYGIDDFDIQVYNNGTWTTVKSVTGAFSTKTHGETCAAERYDFTATTGTKVRILVKKLSDMTAYAGEDAAMATSSHIRLKEITIYEDLNAGASTDPDQTQPTQAPTTAPTTPPVSTDPIKQGTILEIVSPKKITPALGYVSTSDPYAVITEPNHSGEATCMTDGMYYKTAYSLCAASASQYVAAAAILNSATTIGGVEINAHRDVGRDPTAFKIVVKQTDGTWKEVANVTSSPFSSSTRTVMYTFDPVVATEVRVLISSHTDDQVYIAELCLYESKTGNVSNKIDLPVPTGGNTSTSAGYLVDGNKATTTNTYGGDVEFTFNLTNGGLPTAIDHFALYYARNMAINPSSVTIAIKKTAGGAFETIYSGSTGFNAESGIKDSFFAAFDQTYQAYELKLSLSGGGTELYLPEFELYAYERGEGGTTEPTQPTTPPATQPTTPPETEPTETTAPEVPSDPIKQGNILQIVPASKLTTQFGYYSDFTGDDDTTFEDCNDGYCVTDGWFGRAGYSECTSADGLIALVMTLDEAKTLGAIEIIGKNEENNPKCFDVQALIDDEWVSVVSRTDDTFVSGLAQMFDFRKTITTSKIRILIYAVVDAENECYLNEVTLYEATTGNVSQTIDLTGKGGLNDADPAHPIGDLVDNNKTTEFLGSTATFDLTVDGQATAVDGFNLYAFRADADGRHTLPTVVTVQIEKVLGGEYETIGTFETGWVLDGITDVLTAKFDQTYMAYSIKFIFDQWSYANELELFQYVRETEPTEPEEDTILIGASYSIHLVEPWALRTYIQFAENTADNLIPVSNFTSYGVYAIIGNKFEGATAKELMADPDTVKYTKEDENITASDAKTLTFDFYDGLYSFNLDEDIYWVAYFVTADGTYYTGIQEKSLMEVANSLLEDGDVPATEKAILNSMKEMKESMTALRGENADLGHIYPAGAANPGTLGERNKGYLFGTSFKMKLIEPWGVRVRVLMRENAPVVDGKAVYADYASASDYGLIFFHDKDNKYKGAMTAEQMNAETGAKVFSKLDGSAVINAGGVTAIYDQGIYTHELDTELYCLPYIVIDGQYHYPANAIRWNLLGEMVEFSERKDLDDKETAAFKAILTMYDNVQKHK